MYPPRTVTAYVDPAQAPVPDMHQTEHTTPTTGITIAAMTTTLDTAPAEVIMVVVVVSRTVGRVVLHSVACCAGPRAVTECPRCARATQPAHGDPPRTESVTGRTLHGGELDGGAVRVDVQPHPRTAMTSPRRSVAVRCPRPMLTRCSNNSPCGSSSAAWVMLRRQPTLAGDRRARRRPARLDPTPRADRHPRPDLGTQTAPPAAAEHRRPRRDQRPAAQPATTPRLALERPLARRSRPAPHAHHLTATPQPHEPGLGDRDRRGNPARPPPDHQQDDPADRANQDHERSRLVGPHDGR